MEKIKILFDKNINKCYKDYLIENIKNNNFKINFIEIDDIFEVYKQLVKEI
ncbi:hypothetical protein [Spiroplasma taiwanense]|uniref:DUF5615 domain-containing protein n=1 Tax=Spiroplasma taiwanense CT-1 TaxID=1276220 RepID=S5LUB9_9MOLU|nr:hypothetical protein [Spiroplasma taiwanense]AGR41369.1 hypothetical protein STAIW_v1c07720 [Spiroplasma taiwanense CT-1]